MCLKLFLFLLTVLVVKSDGLDCSGNTGIFQGINDIQNPECKSLIIKYCEGINTGIPWARTMLDATGKFPSGIEYGNIFEMGNFDQCLSIRQNIPAGTLRGKYCLASFDLSSITILQQDNIEFHVREDVTTPILGFWAACVPSACPASDIQKLFKFGFLHFDDLMCQTEDSRPELTTGDIIFLSCIGFVALLVVLSTAYDMYLDSAKSYPLWDVLLSFSLKTNSEKLFAVSDSPKQLKCLAGIRVISMMWIVLGHGYLMTTYIPTMNMKDILNWFLDPGSMYLLGATVSVDTFFLLSGLVMVYVCMGMKSMRLMDVPLYYLHRYLRLTPALGVVIALHVTVLKHIGSGPLWPVMSEFMMIKFCRDYWWSNLLYIQNYVNPNEQCVGQSWYLAVDTQLFLLSPLILIPIKKYFKFVAIALVVLTCATIGASFFVAWHYELNALTVEPGANQVDYISQYYIQVYTRAGPWLLGCILGYYIYQYKSGTLKVKIAWPIALLLWIISLAALCACVFAGHNLVTDNDRVLNSLYIALVRPAWAIALSWIVFGCITGYGGPIDKFLSLSIFQVLGRLTYSMYIVHFSTLCIISFSIKNPGRFSDLLQMYNFWGNFMIVLGVSIVLTLFFESPIVAIEKSLTGKNKRNKLIDRHGAFNESLYAIPRLPIFKTETPTTSIYGVIK